MDPVIAVSIIVAVVAVAAVLGLLLRSRAGRARDGDGSSFAPGDLPGLAELGQTATLVQFSTEFCASCPGTRRLLQRIVYDRDDLIHIDVDLTNDPALASRLHILQTPTVFVLDGRGRLASRIGGTPRRDSLVELLSDLSSADSARRAHH